MQRTKMKTFWKKNKIASITVLGIGSHDKTTVTKIVCDHWCKNRKTDY